MPKIIYKGKISTDIRISVDGNVFDDIVTAFKIYNKRYHNFIAKPFITLEYSNNIYTMNFDNFTYRNKKLDFEKAFELVKTGFAELYFTSTMFSKHPFYLKDNTLNLTINNYEFMKEEESIKYQKDIHDIDESLSALIGLSEDYQSDLVLMLDKGQEDSIFVAYKQGEELTNIETETILCNTLYNNYYVDMFNKDVLNQVVIKCKTSIEDNQTISDDELVSILLTKISQNPVKVKLEETEKYCRITFILRNTRLYDVINQVKHQSVIQSYEEKSELFKPMLEKYKTEESYLEYGEFNLSPHYSNIFKPVIHLNELFELMKNRSHLANIQQHEDNLYVEFYNEKRYYNLKIKRRYKEAVR
jgi:hypothetical protein